MQRFIGVVLAFLAIGVFLPEFVVAEKVCIRGKVRGKRVKFVRKIVSSEESCAKKFTEVVDTASLVGPTGATGASGADGAQGVSGPSGPSGPSGASGPDGALAIYGDGSQGALTVSSSTSLDEVDNQYSSFTVNSGQVLTVPSGTIIRSTGTCSIEGTISVSPGAEGGAETNVFTSGVSDLAGRPAHPGHSSRAPAPGNRGDNSNTLFGGAGGIGLSEAEARSLLRPGLFGGGGGGSSRGEGGDGGGAFVLICEGAITGSGTIVADGEDAPSSSNQAGGGGGAGGVLIVASGSSITFDGIATADGGDGEDSSVEAGAGGGGGGGIIHFIAPIVDLTGSTLTVAAGSGGDDTLDITSNPRRSGAGGGALGGDGEQGGNVFSGGGAAATFGDASAGYTFTTTADPASLLL